MTSGESPRIRSRLDRRYAPDRSVDSPSKTGRGRRAEIVRLAAGLFDREGYHTASMEQLADAAGVAKPTLYYYFSGKAEILHEIHREFIELLIRRHEVRLGSALEPSQLLLEVMGDILELMESHRGHVRVFFEHHRDLPPAHKELVRAQRAHYQSMVEDVISAGIDRGDFRPLDVRLSTLAMFGMCNWAYQWFVPSGPLRAREIAYTLWNLLVSGLRDGQRPPPHVTEPAAAGTSSPRAE